MDDLNEQNKLIKSIKSEKDAMQKVKLLTQLVKTTNIQIKDVAQKLGVKSSYVCHLLRLNRLPEVVVDGFYSNYLTLSHLFVISRLKETKQMITVFEKVMAESLTVKATEEVVRDILYGVKDKGEYISPQEKNVFIQKITAFKKNFKFKIIQTRIKSKIILEIKGNLENTSQELRSLMKNLEIWQKA